MDAPAVIVSGVGEGARAAVTVRFADAFERPEDAVSRPEDSVSLDSAAILGADESRGSDRRVAPGGDANGVFAKIDGKDEAVDTRRDDSVSVWTREETMQSRAGGARKRKRRFVGAALGHREGRRQAPCQGARRAEER